MKPKFIANTVRLSCLFSCVGGSIQAFADVNYQDEIVVTATRTQQTVGETLAPVSVITREDIERIQPQDFLDLLNSVPGVDFIRNGSRGSNTSLYMRGTNTNHTLVLVDGVRMNTATLGSANIQYLDPAQIERVEVVRGPRSSLYGADAVGGVIQIFTKKGDGQFRPNVRVSQGTNATEEYVAGVSGKVDTFWYNANASYYDTQGLDSQDDGDDDEYRNRALTLGMSNTFAERITASINYYESKGKNAFDDEFSADSAYSEFDVSTLSTKLAVDATDSLSVSFELGQLKDASDTFDSSPAEITTKRNTANIQGAYSFLSNMKVVAGFDFNDDKVKGSQGYAEDERINRAYYTEYSARMGTHQMSFGVREDENEAFGHELTWNAAWGFNITDKYKVTLAKGTAFRAPTFNDLYWPAGPFGRGNSALRPEKAVNEEIQFSGNESFGVWSMSVFRNEVEDLIEWAPIAPGSQVWTPTNVSKATIEGMEASFGSQVFGWNLNTAVTFINAGNDQGHDLARRARRTMNIDADRDYGKFSAGGTWRLQSGRKNETDDSNPARKEFAGYGTVDLRGAYEITNEVKAKLKVTNLLDKDYTLAGAFSSDYETEGLGAMLSLVYTPAF